MSAHLGGAYRCFGSEDAYPGPVDEEEHRPARQLTVCEERERAIAEKVSANQATLLANLTGLKDCCEATVL